MEITLTDANFEEELKKAKTPMLVDFWATWCPPCKLLGPIVDEISKEFEGKLIVGKLDVDANSQSAMKYQTMSIPTLIFFKNGEAVRREVGYKDKVSLTRIIQEVLNVQ